MVQVFHMSPSEAPKLITSADSFDSAFHPTADKFKLDYYGPEYDTLRTGGQVTLADGTVLVAVKF